VHAREGSGPHEQPPPLGQCGRHFSDFALDFRIALAADQPTADLLTQRLEVREKTAWMLRSLLEN
jgi:hypothetical protein